ncbi:MAG: redoxin domain-containing protein [Rubrobacter sp.]
MEHGPEIGERAPDFDLLAAGSTRRVALRDVAGRRVVLVFHLQGTAPTARGINRAVRARYPDPEEVLVASVIDLSIVPPLYWLSVSLILNQAYDRATDDLSRGVDPSEYVVILPDWGGRVSRAYGARNTGRAAVIVVVDEDSNVAVSYKGERPVEAVLEALDRA